MEIQLKLQRSQRWPCMSFFEEPLYYDISRDQDAIPASEIWNQDHRSQLSECVKHKFKGLLEGCDRWRNLINGDCFHCRHVFEQLDYLLSYLRFVQSCMTIELDFEVRSQTTDFRIEIHTTYLIDAARWMTKCLNSSLLPRYLVSILNDSQGYGVAIL